MAPNRAIAISEVDGAAAALALVEKLDQDNSCPFHAARADLLRRLAEPMRLRLPKCDLRRESGPVREGAREASLAVVACRAPTYRRSFGPRPHIFPARIILLPERGDLTVRCSFKHRSRKFARTPLPVDARVRRRDRLGGLLHEYYEAAA